MIRTRSSCWSRRCSSTTLGNRSVSWLTQKGLTTTLEHQGNRNDELSAFGLKRLNCHCRNLLFPMLSSNRQKANLFTTDEHSSAVKQHQAKNLFYFKNVTLFLHTKQSVRGCVTPTDVSHHPQSSQCRGAIVYDRETAWQKALPESW